MPKLEEVDTTLNIVAKIISLVVIAGVSLLFGLLPLFWYNKRI